MTDKFSNSTDENVLHDRAHKLFNDLLRVVDQVVLPEARKEAPVDTLTQLYACVMLTHVFTMRCRRAADQGGVNGIAGAMIVQELLRAAHGCCNEMSQAVLQGIDPTQNEPGHLSFDALDEIRTMLAPTAGDRKKAEELAAEALRIASIGLKREP
jgi:hypothetical protein